MIYNRTIPKRSETDARWCDRTTSNTPAANRREHTRGSGWLDDRAVSAVLGGILVFGIAMSLLVLLQVSLVPASNQQVEFEHNQELQGDFERFQGSASRVSATGATETVDVDLGVRYPLRLFLMNPAPASGTLQTLPASVTIDNVTSPNGETAEYYAFVGNTLNYDSNRLVYVPNYREYGNAPTTFYENGMVYNRFDGDVTLAVATKPLVNDDKITIMLLDGIVNRETVDSESLALEAASAPAKRIAITENGGPITISLQTLIPESEWETYAAGQSLVSLTRYTDGDGDPSTPNEVVLQLEETRDYTLSVARIGVGEGAAPTTPAYVTSVGEYAESIIANSSVTYTVEVRDAHHNPVSGGEVSARIVGPATFANQMEAQTVTVDEAGRATVVVTGDDNALDDVTVNLGLDTNADGDLGDEDTHMLVTYEFALVATDVTQIDQTADVGGAINPNDVQSGSLVLQSTSTLANGDGQLRFEKIGAGTKTIEEVRVNFASVDSQGNSPIDNFETLKITSVTNGGTVYANTYDTAFQIGANYDAVTNGPIVVQSGAELLVAFQIEGYDNTGNNNTLSTYDLQPGDFVIVSLKFADGTTATYFAGVV